MCRSKARGTYRLAGAIVLEAKVVLAHSRHRGGVQWHREPPDAAAVFYARPGLTIHGVAAMLILFSHDACQCLHDWGLIGLEQTGLQSGGSRRDKDMVLLPCVVHHLWKHYVNTSTSQDAQAGPCL